MHQVARGGFPPTNVRNGGTCDDAEEACPLACLGFPVSGNPFDLGDGAVFGLSRRQRGDGTGLLVGGPSDRGVRAGRYMIATPDPILWGRHIWNVSCFFEMSRVSHKIPGSLNFPGSVRHT